MLFTYTGKEIDYNNINSGDIDIDDIVPSITRINRFLGHTFRPYSVGEHTLMCYFLSRKLNLSPRMQMLVLAHDFAEAYCGDVNTDLKNLVPKFREIEDEFDQAIYSYIGIRPPAEEEQYIIDSIDLTMLVIEMRDLTMCNWWEKQREIGDYMIEDTLNDSNFSLREYDKLSEEYIMEYLFEIYQALLDELRGTNNG